MIALEGNGNPYSNPCKMKSVVQCLQEARSELESALIKLQVGQLQVATELEDETNEYDPDDLAAAFFAQQAHKQQAESKLPIDAWARTIHATSTIARNDEGVWKNPSRFGSNQIVEDTPMLDQTSFDALRTKDNELWKVFESAYADS